MMRIFRAFLLLLVCSLVSLAEEYNGDSRDVLLQGWHKAMYHHQSEHGVAWYTIIEANADAIRQARFDGVWFPPPSASAADNNSYLPTQWYDFNNGFGSKAELVSALQALQPEVYGICDVVLNHRCGKQTGGSDFENPSFPNNSNAVTSDDESQSGTGGLEETHDNGIACQKIEAGRDLDHTDSGVNVRSVEFLQELQELGFKGWRYDMVKGFHGSHVGDYNDHSGPNISIGEFLDGDTQKVVDWVDETDGRSMVFDYPNRFALLRAVGEQNFSHLKTVEGKPPGVIGVWPTMAVTFLDNHDTEDSGAFPPDKVMQGYCYILTHPGIPCVFWPDYFDRGETQKKQIGKLIELRKSTGIGRNSQVFIEPNTQGKYAAIIDDKVAVKLGPSDWSPVGSWSLVLDGNNYAVWEKQ